MPLPSGSISFSQIQSEFGINNPSELSDPPIKMTEYYGLDAGIPTSGSISMSNFLGKSRYYEAPINISSNTNGLNIYNTILPSWTILPNGQKKDANVSITINSGIYIHHNPALGLTGSLATSQPGQHPNWPAKSRINILNNGFVVGQGGSGGNGGGPAGAGGTPGGTGGTAFINLGVTTFITNNGTFGGGGGGGGGGSVFTILVPGPKGSSSTAIGGGGGGGGGRGFPSSGGTGGSGSPASYNGFPGAPGTLSAAGAGGLGGNGSPVGAGGSGGNLGAVGSNGGGSPVSPGGQPGAYISGAPFTTWITQGTRLGTSS